MDTKSKITPEEVVLKFLDARANKNDLDGAMACLDDDFVGLGESSWVPMSKANCRDMSARFGIASPISSGS